MKLLITVMFAILLSGCIRLQFNYYKTVEPDASTQGQDYNPIARTRSEAQDNEPTYTPVDLD